MFNMAHFDSQFVTELSDSYESISRELRKHYNMNFHMYRLMYMIYSAKCDQVTLAELFKYLEWKKPETTKTLNTLSDRGYIERFINKQDRRKIFIEITDKGREEFSEIKNNIEERLGEEAYLNARAYSALSHYTSDKVKLSLTSVRILDFLKKSNEEINRVSDVSEALNLAANTVSAAVRKLEEKNIVAFGTVSHDLRAKSISLTKEGEKVLENALEIIEYFDLKNAYKEIQEIIETHICNS